LQMFLVRVSEIEYKFISRKLAEKSAKDLFKASSDTDLLGSGILLPA